MDITKTPTSATLVEINELENITCVKKGDDFIVSLVDESGYAVLRGIGSTPKDALNDLHKNLT